MLKDSKALETCCYVIGAGAFGIFFRWMQLQLAFDNGLPGKSVWHFFVLLLIAASAAVFWYFIRKFEKAGLSLSGNFFEALSNGGKVYTVLRWALGGILCAGSVLLFMGSELDANVTFLRVLAGFGLLSGISFPLLLSREEFDSYASGALSAVPFRHLAADFLQAEFHQPHYLALCH